MVGVSVNAHNLTFKPIKFLCSSGGRILPRYPDGKLRYQGGETRVLSVNSSISFAELSVKVEELCGSSVSLIRCQLPTEDLDALVSITSDEDLSNLVEEYDYAAAVASQPPKSLKIRTFLSVARTVKQVSPPPSSASSSSSDGSPPKSLFSYCATGGGLPPRCPTSASRRCVRKAYRPPAYPVVASIPAVKVPSRCVYRYHKGHEYVGRVYLTRKDIDWQQQKNFLEKANNKFD